MFKFKQDFLWGVATASFQIEGSTQADGRGKSIWDSFCEVEGKVVNGDTGEIACDHYKMWEEDVDIIHKSNAGVYRFSIAWPRILPNGEGPLNPAGVKFYKTLMQSLKAKGIKPYVTLYHWDLPQALQDKGGWMSRDILKWFETYTNALMEEIIPLAEGVIILNEPSVTAYLGHFNGRHAPGLTGKKNFYACVHHQNLVINQTYKQIKDHFPDKTVGSSYTWFSVLPVSPEDKDKKAATIMDNAWNGVFFDPLFTGKYPADVQVDVMPFMQPGDEAKLKTDLDFVGLQHYATHYAIAHSDELGAKFTSAPESFPRTHMTWPIDPIEFYVCLTNFKHKYNNPTIIITENGCASDDHLENGQVNDYQRVFYYRDYLIALHKFISEGGTVAGYFCWSLLDNFEWAYGYDKRFGLVYVDYKDGCKRYPKASYGFIQQVFKNFGVPQSP